MGARLVVRRVAGPRGGRGGQAVAVETPGEFLGSGFGDAPRAGGAAIPSQGRSWGAGLRGGGRGAEARADARGSWTAPVPPSGKPRLESGSNEAGLRAAP